MGEELGQGSQFQCVSQSCRRGVSQGLGLEFGMGKDLLPNTLVLGGFSSLWDVNWVPRFLAGYHRWLSSVSCFGPLHIVNCFIKGNKGEIK